MRLPPLKPLAFFCSCLFFGGVAHAEDIYSFVDDEGVLHLSNVPQDTRYQPLVRDRSTIAAPVSRPAAVVTAAPRDETAVVAATPAVAPVKERPQLAVRPAVEAPRRVAAQAAGTPSVKPVAVTEASAPAKASAGASVKRVAMTAARSGTARSPLPATADAASYGPVRPGETLGRIARATKTGEVSTEQMTVALFRSNPGAFAGDNLHRLRVGAMLRLPSAQEALQLARMDASRQIIAHADKIRSPDRVLVARSAPPAVFKPEAHTALARAAAVRDAVQAAAAMGGRDGGARLVDWTPAMTDGNWERLSRGRPAAADESRRGLVDARFELRRR